MKNILSGFLEIFKRSAAGIYGFLLLAVEWFMHLHVTERIMLMNTLLIALSIILPSAYFEIFDSRYYINNPVSLTAMTLSLLFIASLFIRWKWKNIVRTAAALYYLVLLFSKVIFNTMTKADPYVLHAGYFIAVISGIVYISSSVYAFLSGEY